jgi:arsenite methyltransferase
MTGAKELNVGFDVESEVASRYAAGAKAAESALCCPVSYDPALLKVIPQEIIDRDYGCGDPSRYVGAGETVLDLGSGGGKICYILAQKVGSEGRVIGVDINDEMLALARKYESNIAAAIGHHVTSFRKGRIQDLALDMDRVEAFLRASPVNGFESLATFEAECDRLRRESPMIADESVDVIVSNCVLNLVKPSEKKRLFGEMFRVLRRGGRCVISDIVCDETPTKKIMDDPALWSGCISGAFVEHEFLQMFEDAGFHGIEILTYEKSPWRVIDGVQFRSMTVRAFKGKQGPCYEHNEAVIYKGPWKQVKDDDGHTLFRGQRMAVCRKTFALMTDPAGPYADSITPVEPIDPVKADEARLFDCRRTSLRSARESKGQSYDLTQDSAGACCGPEGCC